MKWNYLDLFSGIGGFHLGLLQAGFKFNWTGHSEIDKYAKQIYHKHFPESEDLGDVKNIVVRSVQSNNTERSDNDKQPENELVQWEYMDSSNGGNNVKTTITTGAGRTIQFNGRINLITFGFPCQDLSIAGKRRGLKGKRSGLFNEAMRIVRVAKPDIIIFENVKGLFSSNNGRDFEYILREIADAGYDGQWQVLDTQWFLPQSRERIYFVGHPRAGSRPEVFPIGEDDCDVTGSQGEEQREGERFRGNDSRDIIANTIRARCYKDGSENLIQIGNVDKKGHNSIWGRVYDPVGISSTLNAEGGGLGAKTGLYDVRAVIGLDRLNKGQNGRRFKENGEPMFTLTGRDRHGVEIREATKKGYAVAEEGDSINLSVPSSKTRRGRVRKGEANTLDTGQHQYTIQPGKEGEDISNMIRRIRRLTPLECERLQGFPDNWTAVGTSGPISGSQRYKMIGNAASIPPVKAVMKKLKKHLTLNK